MKELTRKDFEFIDRFCKEYDIPEGNGDKTMFAIFLKEYKNEELK